MISSHRHLSGSKVTLAARVDSFHESTDGHIGMEYKEDIEKKIDKVVYHNCIIFYLILLPPPFLITSSYPSLPPSLPAAVASSESTDGHLNTEDIEEKMDNVPVSKVLNYHWCAHVRACATHTVILLVIVCTCLSCLNC